MWWPAALLGAVALLIPTAYAGFIGAPYVPTRQRALQKAFDALTVGPNDVVVDLGCGDGGVLLEASRRDASSIGYELSPILWAIAWVRGRGSRRTKVRGVRLRNFYRQKLPADTTILFVFLMPKNLPRLLTYLRQQHLPRARYVLSYTFALPNLPPRHIITTPTHGTVYAYTWDQLQL